MRKIKGLRAIYEPKGAAREYGALAVNLFNGCTCGCRYCYVPRMPGFPSREVFRAALRHGEGETYDHCDGCAYNNDNATLRANCVGCKGFEERPHKVARPNAPEFWWEAKTTDKKE